MSCGLGAVILVFMLVKFEQDVSIPEEDLLKADLARLQAAEQEMEEVLAAMRARNADKAASVEIISKKIEGFDLSIDELEKEKAKKREQLAGIKNSIEKIQPAETSDVIDKPDSGEENYLIGLKVEGSRIGIGLRGRILRDSLVKMLVQAHMHNEKDAERVVNSVLNARILKAKRPYCLKWLDWPITRFFLGRATSSIEEDDFRLLKKDVKDVRPALPGPPGEKKGAGDEGDYGPELGQHFSIMETTASKRFQGRIRLITIAWSAVVAFSFQISVFDVLRDVSTNETLRAELVMASAEVTRLASDSLQKFEIQDLSSEALDKLAAQHPSLRDKLEEVSGIGHDREALIEELRAVATGDPELRRLVPEYEKLLADLYRERIEEGRELAESAVSQLARYDYTLFPNGSQFYGFGKNEASVPVVSNWLGVLATIILLTFGAPFWFEQLKNLARLKDGLQRIQKRDDGDAKSGK